MNGSPMYKQCILDEQVSLYMWVVGNTTYCEHVSVLELSRLQRSLSLYFEIIHSRPCPCQLDELDSERCRHRYHSQAFFG